MTRLRHRVEWKPANKDGTCWVAYVGSEWQGRIARMENGRYDCWKSNRHFSSQTVKTAGLRMVAQVNGVYPGLLHAPR